MSYLLVLSGEDYKLGLEEIKGVLLQDKNAEFLQQKGRVVIIDTILEKEYLRNRLVYTTIIADFVNVKLASEDEIKKIKLEITGTFAIDQKTIEPEVEIEKLDTRYQSEKSFDIFSSWVIVDVVEVGASYTFGNDMVLGVGGIATAADQDDGTGTLIGNNSDDSVFGVTLSGIMLGDVGIGIGAQAQDDDTSFLADVTWNGLYFHVEANQVDKDSPASFDGDNQDRLGVTLGYTQSLGRKTTMYYELYNLDNDTDGGNKDDLTRAMAVLKYDII